MLAHPAALSKARSLCYSAKGVRSRVGGSSNGRTADSDSASLGSNPSPPATWFSIAISTDNPPTHMCMPPATAARRSLTGRKMGRRSGRKAALPREPPTASYASRARSARAAGPSFSLNSLPAALPRGALAALSRSHRASPIPASHELLTGNFRWAPARSPHLELAVGI
jgi:hypothetical protein